jgi:hypothetical protein
MEKLDITKLIGQSKEYDISGTKLVLRPLTLEELPLILKTQKEDVQADALKEIVFKTLQKSYEGITKEEVEKISIEHFKPLIDAIIDVNNLNIEKKQPTMVV